LRLFLYFIYYSVNSLNELISKFGYSGWTHL